MKLQLLSFCEWGYYNFHDKYALYLGPLLITLAK